MGRVSRNRRRTRLQAAADEVTQQLLKKLGRALRDGRTRLAWTQLKAAHRAGISRSEWSALELGRRTATVGTLNRAAFALGTGLSAYVPTATAADQPRDAVQLRCQELIIRTGLEGAWQGLPEELIDREARTSRAADVVLHRRRLDEPAEYGLYEVIDWFKDVGEPLRGWSRRLDGLERYAISRMQTDEPLPRVSGCWVLRATQRNRQLLREHRHLFQARFPGSGSAWLAAMTQPDRPMPTAPAILWVTVKGDRLYPARLG